jgi:hypothetical protein
MKMENKVEGRPFVDVVIWQSVTDLEQLTSENEMLLVEKNFLFVLDLHLDVVGHVQRLDLKSDCLACPSHHKDLHATAETKSYGGVNKWSEIYDVHNIY